MPLSAFFGEGDKKNTFASLSKDHTRQVPEEKPWLRGRRGLATIFFSIREAAQRYTLGKRKSRVG